jgi:hypothetical protein
MAEDTPQLAASESKRRWYQFSLRSLMLGMLTPAVVMIIIAIGEGVLGYRRSGVVPTFGDLPQVGYVLEACQADGPVAYWFSRHPHGVYNYLVCGHASESQIKTLCEKLHLTSRVLDAGQAGESGWPNGQFQEVAQAAGAKTYWNGPFGVGDFILLPKRGQTIGGYRRSDGWFSINLVFTHELEADDQQDHTR